MRILIIHQHFRTPASGGAIRSYYLGKALVEAGINVAVITAGNHRKDRVYDYEGIEVHSMAVPYDNSFSFSARSESFLKFVRKAYITARAMKAVDLCYTISVPLTTGLIARALKVTAKLPFVFEVGDLWPDAPIEMGYIRNYFFKRLLFDVERSIYREARAVVALSPAIRDAIAKKMGRLQHEIRLIPNMSDTEFYHPERKDQQLKDKFGVKNELVVSYIGAIGAANGLDYFIECARASMQQAAHVRFFVCGEGALLQQHQENVNRLGLTNLTFVPFQKREGVHELMNITDCMFVCYKPYAILETGSPNKYFDGLAAGKMIVINFGGWIREEIEREGCGIALDKRRPSEFPARLQNVINDRILLDKYQQSARRLAEGKYSRKILVAEFLSVIRSSVGRI